MTNSDGLRDPQPTTTSLRVVDRRIVSTPGRVIEIEQVTVSREQQCAVAAAFRVGSQSVDTKD